MDSDEAEEARRAFLEDWPDLTRIGVTDALAARAGDLAWQHDLRAYDAAQLAAALTWRDEREDVEGDGRPGGVRVPRPLPIHSHGADSRRP